PSDGASVGDAARAGEPDAIAAVAARVCRRTASAADNRTRIGDGTPSRENQAATAGGLRRDIAPKVDRGASGNTARSSGDQAGISNAAVASDPDPVTAVGSCV